MLRRSKKGGLEQSVHVCRPKARDLLREISVCQQPIELDCPDATPTQGPFGPSLLRFVELSIANRTHGGLARTVSDGRPCPNLRLSSPYRLAALPPIARAVHHWTNRADRAQHFFPRPSCRTNWFVEVIAQTVRRHDEKHSQQLAIPFIDAPICDGYAV